MDQQEAIIKLKALHNRLRDQLANERARYFQPKVALEFFEMFIPVRDRLRELFPNLLADFPIREIPAPNPSSDSGGTGTITRWQLEPLLRDMQHLIEIMDATGGANGSSSGDTAQQIVLPPVDKISARWLWENVPIQFWLTYLALLISAFILGVHSSRFHFVREIFGL